MDDKLLKSAESLIKKTFNAGKKEGKSENSGKKGESTPKSPEFKRLEKIASKASSNDAKALDWSKLRKVLRTIADKEESQLTAGDMSKIVSNCSVNLVKMGSAKSDSKPE